MRILITTAALAVFATAPSFASDNTADIIFNVEQYPVLMPDTITPPPQQVTLLSCGPKKKNIEIDWNKRGQIFAEHYGYAPNSDHFTSKYYLASPPVFNNDKQAILGQLIPDRFTFKQPDIKQEVAVTYSVLPPVTSKQIQSDFTSIDKKHPQSCEQQGVTLVPINIQCKDFPRLSGKKGAAGIGFLEYNSSHFDKIFIANHPKNPNKAMNCTATILEDIIPKHKVTFANGKNVVNMAKLHENKQKMQFMCSQRQPDILPKGCQPPK